jgi:hypothetical protein
MAEANEAAAAMPCRRSLKDEEAVAAVARAAAATSAVRAAAARVRAAGAMAAAEIRS